MPYYETTFETGNVTVGNYEDDAEAQRALGEHQRRAVNGELGGPEGTNWAAERIAKVRVYSSDPGEYNPEGTMSADVLLKELDALVKALADENGVVNVNQLAVEVRGLTHPMVAAREHPFDSRYKMKEDRELDLAFLEGGAANA